ncbi:tetratricopeptide repeat protein [Sphingobacterium bambusae]|uniref:Tetratricopeptide repeat protein n=2 Tax=Sphingobacterium bambusae TaxID=662858 RepID=A0ABW6BKM1_9SPHI|nr:tetratricopeptide repeat protein [Sphingobacterium bambusae]WPL50976.1 tetratricopeptide repeat protein [Sphingobacterium bambusae]
MISFRTVVKIFLVGLQIVVISSSLAYFIYHYFAGSYSHRFHYAELRQGSLKSDFIFSILGMQYPNNADVLHERSVAFNKRGMYARGFQLLDSAVHIDPASHLGYRGWIKLHMLRDYKGALRDFLRQDALTADHVDYPMSENIHFLKAICYDKLGDHETALTCFDTARTSSMDGFVDYKIDLYKAIVLFQNNRETNAAAIFRQVLEQYPKCSEAYYYLARIYKHSNRKDEAATCASLARAYYLQGYKLKNAYNEMPYEIYLEDINLLNCQITSTQVSTNGNADRN